MSVEVKVARLPKCDWCESEATYDGKTIYGPWANMCDFDFNSFGIGLGTGLGQRLVLIEGDEE